MPRESVMSDVAAWASALQLDSAWMENASVQELDLPQQHEALFLRFYLAVLRYFYEWARIPIFENRESSRWYGMPARKINVPWA